MSVNYLVASLSILLDLVQNQETGQEIERDLNAQFSGRTWTLTNYKEEDVKIEIDSITARPKFLPQESVNGAQEVEVENIFTKYEDSRESPTFKERLSAVMKSEWITVVRLSILDGNAESLRPSGLNLGYATSTRSLRLPGEWPPGSRGIAPIPHIRVAETHEVQSDKLEIKIGYSGSIGEYGNRVSDAIDLLRDVQDDMEVYVFKYLLELHHSGQINNDEFAWPDRDQAMKLGSFFAGCSVDLDSLATVMDEFKSDLRTRDIDEDDSKIR